MGRIYVTYDYWPGPLSVGDIEMFNDPYVSRLEYKLIFFRLKILRPTKVACGFLCARALKPRRGVGTDDTQIFPAP